MGNKIIAKQLGHKISSEKGQLRMCNTGWYTGRAFQLGKKGTQFISQALRKTKSYCTFLYNMHHAPYPAFPSRRKPLNCMHNICTWSSEFSRLSAKVNSFSRFGQKRASVSFIWQLWISLCASSDSQEVLCPITLCSQRKEYNAQQIFVDWSIYKLGNLFHPLLTQEAESSQIWKTLPQWWMD